MGMNRDVYSYLLKTYGREPWHGAGFVLIIQTLMMYAAAPLLPITHRYYSLWQKQTEHGSPKTTSQKPKQRKATLQHA